MQLVSELIWPAFPSLEEIQKPSFKNPNLTNNSRSNLVSDRMKVVHQQTKLKNREKKDEENLKRSKR